MSIELNINDDIKKIEENINKIQPPPMLKVKKNLVLCYPSDSTGCGHVRFIYPFTYLNSVFAKEGHLVPSLCPIFIRQNDMLTRARTLYFQRQMTDEHKTVIMSYKENQNKFRYKINYDLDDLLWGKNEKQGGDIQHGIPSYNFASIHVSDNIKQNVIDIMKAVDLVTVSTQTLKDYIQNELKIQTPVEVVWNTVPMYLYGKKKRQKLTEDIIKPRVLYSQSPTHYSNQEKLKGDLDNAWLDWIIESVSNNEIEFYCMGGLPWFFEGIKHKITVLEWTNTFSYITDLKALEPHFVITPLVPNVFNSCKSDIKYIESSAVGAIGIGTYFTNGLKSPYDNNIVRLSDNCSKSDIYETIEKCCKYGRFNEIMELQYQALVRDGRYTESPLFINKLLEII